MVVHLNDFALQLSLTAFQQGSWMDLPLHPSADGDTFTHKGIEGRLHVDREHDHLEYTLDFRSHFKTRLRLQARLLDELDLFHLIPGNIHGDNNAPFVRPGEFPCLTSARPAERNCAPLWEFRADRASHPVSILCCQRGAVGISIDPYSPSRDADDGFIRNGLFAALPDRFGVALGYGNDPLTFVEKTHFAPATADLTHRAGASGNIFAVPGAGRLAAHRIVRALYEEMRSVPQFSRSFRDALRALADAFAKINFSPEIQQYTNRKCRVPVDLTLEPWRAIVEIGWTGGSVLAHPFQLAERLFPDLKFPKDSAQIFNEIVTGFNESSGFLNDTTLNRFTRNRPKDWNASEINGWWSGFLPQTPGNHCAYTNAHAAYYLLRAASNPLPADAPHCRRWVDVALRVLDTAVELQRDDGAFGYIFSSSEKKVVDFDGFAGCWFAPALVHAWKLTSNTRYRDAAARALHYYRHFVTNLACWGTPMDTFKSVDSEGNLAFIRAAKLMHTHTTDPLYLDMLQDGANYEYLWRYGFRARPQSPPLKDSDWNSCGGSITSVSNPHIHPMSTVVTEDLHYLARKTGDAYHANRADDGIAWLMNTMELYPQITGYGAYGILSERTCPSDGLLVERYHDDNSASSTWWSYNAWAAASAMEAIAERIIATEEQQDEATSVNRSDLSRSPL
jgi:hypothetical protein